jgi:hypothetical protein
MWTDSIFSMICSTFSSPDVGSSAMTGHGCGSATRQIPSFLGKLRGRHFTQALPLHISDHSGVLNGTSSHSWGSHQNAAQMVTIRKKFWRLTLSISSCAATDIALPALQPVHNKHACFFFLTLLGHQPLRQLHLAQINTGHSVESIAPWIPACPLLRSK